MQDTAAVLHRIPKSPDKLFGLTRQQCYDLLEAGTLAGVRIGNVTYITDASLRDLPGKLPQYAPRTSPKAQRLTAARKRKAAAEVA